MPTKTLWTELREVPDKTIWEFQFENKDYGCSDDTVIFEDTVTNRSLTHGERFRQAKAFGAGLLLHKNWRKGDLLLLFSKSHIDTATITAGVHYASGVVTSANFLWNLDEIAYALKDCKPRVVVAQPEYLNLIQAAVKATDSDEICIMALDDESHGDIASWRSISTDSSIHNCPSPERVDPEKDLAYIIYTAGTCVRPKGVMMSHKAMITYTMNTGVSNRPFRRKDQERTIALPEHTIAGLVTRDYSMYDGSRCFTTSDYSLENFLCLVQKYKIHWAFATPPSLTRLVHSAIVNQYDLSSLRWLGTMGSPFPAYIAKALWHRFKIPVRIHYGLTEVCGQVSAQCILETLSTVGSCGHLSAGIEAKVLDPEGQEVREGNPGHLWVKSTSLMLGYLNQPALSEELLDKDGFFATGDLVSMRDGILTVYGRMCDQIKCNGETYMTADLEKVLKEHGKVADCSVIAVPGKDGPVPWAFAVINSLGSSCPTLLPRELINFIEHQSIEGMFQNGGLKIIPTIPRTPSGKLKRVELEGMVDG